MSVDQARQQGGVAEIMVGPANTGWIDGDDALAGDGDRAPFERRRTDREEPASGGGPGRQGHQMILMYRAWRASRRKPDVAVTWYSPPRRANAAPLARFADRDIGHFASASFSNPSTASSSSLSQRCT